MECSFKSITRNYKSYKQMYVGDALVAETVWQGDDVDEYLVSLYFNEKYKHELTEIANMLCKVSCRCFNNNQWYEAKGSYNNDYFGLYLIDGVGQITINQNARLCFYKLLNSLGYSYKRVGNRMVFKKEKESNNYG